MRAHLTALFLAAAVIAAACGSGTDGADSLSTSNASSSAGDVSKTEPEPSGTSGETPLTASFRGVTATTIEIGIALVDFQQLVELGFIENSHGDERLIWNTLIDDLNASGGVGGRLLEPIFDSYVPFGSTQAEISCLRLTEDNAVFAVLGLWIGDSVLCITRQHNTIHIGDLLRQEWMDVSTAPLVTPDMTAERRLSTLLNLLIESGKLGGVDIGVFADRTSGPTIDSIVRPALADAGLTPRSVAVLNEDLDDLVSAESEIDVLVERWRSDGIDLLIVVGNNGNALIPDIRQALDIDVASDNLDVLRQLARPGRAGIEAFDGVLVLDRGRPSDVESAGPKLRRCLDTFQAANPDVEILARADVPPGGADWLIGVLDACAILAIFVAAAEAAGPELTNDSWQQGLETLNDFVVPGQQYSSFGPDKWDAHDGARLAEFRVEDLATRLEPLGELVDTAE